MKQKMPWLKDRLRTLNQTPTALARHLHIAAPRVHEMISGKRAMQPDEIEPTAAFLKWSVNDLLARLPKQARVLPVSVHEAVQASASPKPSRPNTEPPPIGVDKTKTNAQLTKTRAISMIPILATITPFA